MFAGFKYRFFTEANLHDYFAFLHAIRADAGGLRTLVFEGYARDQDVRGALVALRDAFLASNPQDPTSVCPPHGRMSHRMTTCHAAWPHVTPHDHMSHRMAACQSTWSHDRMTARQVTLHGMPHVIPLHGSCEYSGQASLCRCVLNFVGVAVA